MAVTGFSLKTNGSAGAGSSHNTASITLTSGNLYFLVVLTENSSASTRNKPTCSGWTEVDSYQHAADRDNFYITVLKKVGDGTTAALTIDYAGQSQSFKSWQVIEVTGSSTSWTTVQSVHALGYNSTATATMAAFADATNNAAFSVCGGYTYTSPSTPTNYTSISTATGDLAWRTVYNIGVSGGDLSPSFGTVTDDWVVITIEVQSQATETIVAVPVASFTFDAGTSALARAISLPVAAFTFATVGLNKVRQIPVASFVMTAFAPLSVGLSVVLRRVKYKLGRSL